MSNLFRNEFYQTFSGIRVTFNKLMQSGRLRRRTSILKNGIGKRRPVLDDTNPKNTSATTMLSSTRTKSVAGGGGATIEPENERLVEAARENTDIPKKWKNLPKMLNIFTVEAAKQREIHG